MELVKDVYCFKRFCVGRRAETRDADGVNLQNEVLRRGSELKILPKVLYERRNTEEYG